MGLEEYPAEWMDSFMSDSRVIMSVDGKDDEPSAPRVQEEPFYHGPAPRPWLRGRQDVSSTA